jgi:hypothetical protein
MEAVLKVFMNLKLSNDADTAKLHMLVLVEEMICGDCDSLIKCHGLHLCDMQ